MRIEIRCALIILTPDGGEAEDAFDVAAGGLSCEFDRGVFGGTRTCRTDAEADEAEFDQFGVSLNDAV